MSVPTEVLQFPVAETQEPTANPSHAMPPRTAANESDTPLLVSAQQLARLLEISVRTLWRMDAAGQIPRAGQLMKMKRWDRQEIQRWLQARRRDGTYPDRRDWELMEASRRPSR